MFLNDRLKANVVILVHTTDITFQPKSVADVIDVVRKELCFLYTFVCLIAPNDATYDNKLNFKFSSDNIQMGIREIAFTL